MKKVLLPSLFVFAFYLSACAEKIPPQAVLTAFQQKFPAIKDIDWENEKNGEWEAEFEMNGTEMSANFTPDGKWLETEKEIKFTDLPAPVQDALKGKKVKELAKIERADGTTIFEAEVKHKDLLFDTAGKMVK